MGHMFVLNLRAQDCQMNEEVINCTCIIANIYPFYLLLFFCKTINILFY